MAGCWGTPAGERLPSRKLGANAGLEVGATVEAYLERIHSALLAELLYGVFRGVLPVATLPTPPRVPTPDVDRETLLISPLVEPEGEDCQLHNSQVSGTVTVLADTFVEASNNTIGGTVRVTDRTEAAASPRSTLIRLAANNIGGNVEATGVGLLRLTNTLGGTVNSPNNIGGSVIAKEGSNLLICETILPTGSIQVRSQTVTGNAHIGGGFCIPSGTNPDLGGGNTLNGGGIQVANNEFQSETLGLDLSNNQVAQDIQVKEHGCWPEESSEQYCRRESPVQEERAAVYWRTQQCYWYCRGPVRALLARPL